MDNKSMEHCKIPEFWEIQTCIDVPVLLHSIWELFSNTLFACTIDYMYFFQFLPLSSGRNWQKYPFSSFFDSSQKKHISSWSFRTLLGVRSVCKGPFNLIIVLRCLKMLLCKWPQWEKSIKYETLTSNVVFHSDWFHVRWCRLPNQIWWGESYGKGKASTVQGFFHKMFLGGACFLRGGAHVGDGARWGTWKNCLLRPKMPPTAKLEQILVFY